MASPPVGTVRSFKPKPTRFDKYSGQEKRAFIMLKKMKPAGRRAYARKVNRDPSANPEYRAAINRVAKDNPHWMDPSKKS